MSILAAADPDGSGLGPALAVFAGMAAVTAAALTGVLRLPPPARAPRVPAGRPLMPLVGVMFLGVLIWVLIWVFVPSLYYQLGRGGDAAAAPAPPPTPLPPPPTALPTTTAGGAYGLGAREVVTLNAAVPVLAFVVIALGDAAVRPVVGQRLGFGVARLGPGLLWGGVGIVLALPLVYCVMVLAAWLYRAAGYEHPKEHDLLRTMGETPDAFVKYLAVIVAVAIAPLWEELLFRGHVQTLVREWLVRLSESGRPAATGTGSAVRAVKLDYAPPALVATGVGPAFALARESWLAVGITSLLFAGVHEPWQVPPVFCLSLCLGLAYERTGNLWVPVVMHASFNGLMTAFFLAGGTITD